MLNLKMKLKKNSRDLDGLSRIKGQRILVEVRMSVELELRNNLIGQNILNATVRKKNRRTF